MKLIKHRSGRLSAQTRGGFSLLELVIVISIMAILAGAAIPVARRAIDHAARKATLAELDAFSTATIAFFEDTGVLPENVRALTHSSGLTGWTGPYLGAIGKDLRTGVDSAEVDGWSFAYRVELEGESAVVITSPGVDGKFDFLEDFSVRVDVTSVRREKTLRLLKTLNMAVDQYNEGYLLTDPLPANFDELLGKLVTRGLLPAKAPWAKDGWGTPFVVTPADALPVVRVGSATMLR